MAAPQLPRPTRFLHLGTEHTLCFREPWPLWSCGFFVLSCQTKQSHQLWVQNTQWCDFFKIIFIPVKSKLREPVQWGWRRAMHAGKQQPLLAASSLAHHAEMRVSPHPSPCCDSLLHTTIQSPLG